MGQKLSGLRGLFRFMEARRIEGLPEGEKTKSPNSDVTQGQSTNTSGVQVSQSMECQGGTDDSESNISPEGKSKQLIRPTPQCQCPSNIAVSTEDAGGYGAIGMIRPRRENGESRNRRGAPRVKTKSSKEASSGSGTTGTRKKRSSHWASRLNGKLKGGVIKSSEVEIPEPNMGGEACICTGYRRTEEHLLGPGVVFEAENRESFHDISSRRAGPSCFRESDADSFATRQRSGAEILHSAAGAIIDFPIEDCDELARLERAREIAEGVEPPPGFRPIGENQIGQPSTSVLPSTISMQLAVTNSHQSQQPTLSATGCVDMDTLTALFQTRLGVPGGSFNVMGVPNIEEPSSASGNVVHTQSPEPNMSGEACVCTGYRRTEEHLLGPGVAFEAENRESFHDTSSRRAGPSCFRESEADSIATRQRSGAEILNSAAGAIIDFPIEDCDELARLERAREIAEGVEPPPGFRPIGESQIGQPSTSVLPPTINMQLAVTNSHQSQQPTLSASGCVDMDTLTALFQTRLGVPGGSFNVMGVPNIEEPPSASGNVVHTQVDYIHCLVPDLLRITACSFYWGKMDRYEAERLLESRPEGTFLLRDSAQEEHLFSVSFRKYGRSLHARVEQWNHRFSFDSHDPGVFASPTVTGLVEHYKDHTCCMFFEPMLSLPLHRSFPFPLQHLCRAVVCSRTSYDAIATLRLPNALKAYLKEYHYKQRVRVRRFDSEH